ncbi:MAG TPA: prolyl oligopeptidase family serine peptidase [Pyrinomonadaceae bacterium]|nr:prolyl oligopeptidase family serine peptidase [Pyrinomonadaceae bacterium]
MRLISTRKIVLLLALLINSIDAVVPIAATAQENDSLVNNHLRTWTPQDSVGVRNIVLFPSSPLALGAGTPSEGREPIVWSPDGEVFFFMIRRGELGSDSNIYELQVFRSADVRAWLVEIGAKSARSLTPWRTVVQRTISSTSPAISGARWDLDSKSIVYWGLDNPDPETHQVLRLDLPSGKVDRLTDYPKAVHGGVLRWFDYSNGTLIYNGYHEKEIAARYPMETVALSPGGTVMSLDLRMRVEANDNTTGILYVSYRGGRPLQLSSRVRFARAVWMSPDGRKAVIRAQVGKSEEFVLADLENNRVSPMLGAPVGGFSVQGMANQSLIQPKALWSTDSRRVILINTRLPADSVLSERKGDMYIVDYDVEKGTWKIVTPIIITEEFQATRYVTFADWSVRGRKLLVKHTVNRKYVSAVEYSIEAKGLTPHDVPASLEAPKKESTLKHLAVQLRQSANDPPMIVASDGQHEGTLTSQDPTLNGIQIARQRPFSWDENGKTVTGGLTLPSGWSQGPQLPLVIQTYFYEPDLFLPDGVNTTSDATQALAARGIAVLQIPTQSLVGPPNEGPQFAARMDAAVEALTREGIIDPTRVGLSGHSRMGYDTYWTITHPRETRFAASISTDSFTGSYYNYLSDLSSGRGQTDEALGGKGSFWQNKSKWLDDETSFNIDRVITPALFTVNNSTQESDIYKRAGYLIAQYGAFLRNNKPMEVLLFPKGEHQLLRPRERLEMMTAVVDWYCFWLKGEIPPDPERAKRWERLRKMQQAVIAEQVAKGIEMAPLPPLVPAPSWVKPLPNFDAPAPKTKKAVNK